MKRGDQYLWIVIDSDSRLAITYHVGKRDGYGAYSLMADLNRRVVPHHRFQISTAVLRDTFRPSKKTSGLMWTSRSSRQQWNPV